jgi:pyridoxal phosphate enzyme (YggS family)
MDEQLLSDNITKLLQRVRRAAEKSQYSHSDILLVAVSKTQPEQAIRAAHKHGLTHFGENYLSEALNKIAALQDLDLTWHFIGPVQANKTAPIAQHFSWVHSIDRAKIAVRLNEQRPPQLPPLQVCLQVNISGEASKSGVRLDELSELARTVLQLPRLQLRGLMAIPAAAADSSTLNAAFGRMREALAELQESVPHADTLSMGMSDDLEIAIAEGATMVRVGTAIFGPRNR